MRKITLGILTIMLFTLSLTCVMTYCPMEAKAAETEQDCPECPKSGHDSDKNKGSAMLMQDCLDVDLFAQDAKDNYKPKQSSGDLQLMAWADLNLSYNFLPLNAAGIRGPPPYFPDADQNYPPLFLTTQRLRL